ncbi:MAG TPA: hypothetical protein VF365_10400 [Candidatus Limnocylindria bacterium]
MTLSAWAGGVVYLTSSFAERTFDAAPGGHPTAGDLLAITVVLVGLLFIIRELLVPPAAAPPSQVMQRPILVVAAIAVTAVLLAAEAKDLGLWDEGVVSAQQGLGPIGILAVGPPANNAPNITRAARRTP